MRNLYKTVVEFVQGAWFSANRKGKLLMASGVFIVIALLISLAQSAMSAELEPHERFVIRVIAVTDDPDAMSKVFDALVAGETPAPSAPNWKKVVGTGVVIEIYRSGVRASDGMPIAEGKVLNTANKATAYTIFARNSLPQKLSEQLKET